MKCNYIPVLNVLMITYSLGLHKICILKKAVGREHSLLFVLFVDLQKLTVKKLKSTL